MSFDFLHLPRVPEPEEMDDAEEVSSYGDAAVERHLDRIDDTFVDRVVRLTAGMSGVQCWLDVGSGPAQIPIKLLKRLPKLRIVAADRSRNMLLRARRDAVQAGVSDRLLLVVCDGHRLPFPSGQFSFAMCNSVLHHARSPVDLLREIGRAASSGAPLLLRDLRRPNRFMFRWHLWRHGKNYRGPMRKLFNDSVRAAYTLVELQELAEQSAVPDTRVFRSGQAHLAVERKRNPR